MTQERYLELCEREGAVQMERATWNGKAYHEDLAKRMDVTVLICQKNTPDLIKLCIESLFAHYPEIPTIVVDGVDDSEKDNPNDSTIYLRYKEKTHSNLKVVPFTGVNSHGRIMHMAIMEHVKTTFVLLMDSDIIVERHGMIEGMLQQFKYNNKLFAIGAMMLVTKKNYAVGAPEDDNDVLKYIHPSTAIYHVPTYKSFPSNAQMADHGAPLVFVALEAEQRGLDVESYPVDMYTAHNSGSSWQEVNAIWANDHNVFLRPFITFICTNEKQYFYLRQQKDHDFDVVTEGNFANHKIVFQDDAIPVSLTSYLFNIRFNVIGEYVCRLGEEVSSLSEGFVKECKLKVIEANAPDELVVSGLLLRERKKWQRNTSIT